MPQLTQEQLDTLKSRGLSDQTISDIARQKGYDLPGAGVQGAKGFGLGAVKGLVGGVARPTAQLLQGAGQRVLSALTPASLEEVRATTGFKSLDDRTKEGQAVSEMLRPKGKAEKAGDITANIATWFIPTAKTTQVAGRGVQGAGKVISKLGIGISAKEAPLVQSYRAVTPLTERMANLFKGKVAKNAPRLNRETALEFNIFGTESSIGVQSRRAAKELWNGVISPKLKSAKTKINFQTDFIGDLQKNIDSITDLSRRKQLQKGLDAFKDDFAKVGDITYEQLQKFKEGWTTFLPEKAYKGEQIAGIFREIQNMASQVARNKIYQQLGEGARAAYLDYGNLKNLQKLGEKALTQSKLKGGAGSLVSGIKDMALTPIATTGGMILYRAGKGLEFIGTKGLKTVKNIFGIQGGAPAVIGGLGVGAGVNQFNQEDPNNVSLGDVAKEIPGQLGRVAVGPTIRAGATLAELPQVMLGGEPFEPFNVPGLGKFDTFGRQAVDDAEKIGTPASVTRAISEGILSVAYTASMAELIGRTYATFAQASGNITPTGSADGQAIKSLVDNHIKTAKTLQDSMPPARFNELGGTQKLIERTQTNIVDGLLKTTNPTQEMLKMGNAIKMLNASKYKTLDAFIKAVESLL